MAKSKETLIAVVVDDLIIAADKKRDTMRVIRQLRKAGLDTKDLGSPEYVIGMHVKRHRNGDISINQDLYIETLLRRFEMQDTHTVSTAADTNVKLSKKLEPKTKKEKERMSRRPYRSLVGALLYVLITRPDCAVAVNELARFLNNPGSAMWTAAKRVLRYLKGTKGYRIRFKGGHRRPKGNKTSTFVDASHDDDRDERDTSFTTTSHQSRGEHFCSKEGHCPQQRQNTEQQRMQRKMSSGSETCSARLDAASVRRQRCMKITEPV